MPYTPPSRSPASSTSSSPNVSRRSSLQTGPRPSLPRSASYLHKHRRTPSATNIAIDGSTGPLTPQGTSEDLKSMVSPVPTNVRQSPPPVTDERTMPMGAIISPPDSASSGSDEEGELQIRGRKLEKLKDLRDAVSQIPQPRTPSPQRTHHSHADAHRQGVHFSYSTSSLGTLAKSGRKIGHIRAATEPHVPHTKSADNSLTTSEDDSDEDKKKPQMVRKKSGELVRPALRPSSRRRPSSMPGTPIFSKAVHFDSHLEHVRHFLQVDRPLAVSAGSSPVDAYDSDREYPFPGDERSGARSPPFEWELVTSNFPHDSVARQSLPVRLEKVWLSHDQKSMLGSVAVANLAFQKAVTCRFTLDYWKTTSEVAAEYSHEIRDHDSNVSHDRFTFSIKLADTANLESKTLFFCIRYAVNGQEYWDNNNSANFQVDFRKKHLPMNGKNNFQGAAGRSANGLPRSNRRAGGNNLPRPKSMPVTFADLGDDSKLNFDQPIHEYLGESGSGGGLRLKTKSHGNLADNMTKGFSSPSGVAFSNRYDFGASLSAAVEAAKVPSSKEKDGLYMKANVRAGKPLAGSTNNSTDQPAGRNGPNTQTPPLSSSSYEELVNKYCFFGSKQSSPTLKDGTMNGSRFDGTSGEAAPLPHSTHGTHHAGAATHHTLQLGPTGPFFRPGHTGSPPVATGVLMEAAPINEASSLSTPRPAVASSITGPVYTTASYDGAPSGRAPYSSQHGRFPFAGDSHAATAIRG